MACCRARRAACPRRRSAARPPCGGSWKLTLLRPLMRWRRSVSTSVLEFLQRRALGADRQSPHSACKICTLPAKACLTGTTWSSSQAPAVSPQPHSAHLPSGQGLLPLRRFAFSLFWLSAYHSPQYCARPRRRSAFTLGWAGLPRLALVERAPPAAPAPASRPCTCSSPQAQHAHGALRHTQNSRTFLAEIPRRLQSWRSMASPAAKTLRGTI